MRRGPAICPLAPAHLAGLGAFQAAIILAFIDYRLAAVPLVLFLVACFAAPFVPRSCFYLPVTSRGRRDSRAVALTFDDGPDPATTPRLLYLLESRGVTACFFVTGERADRHPGLVREILARGHSIGNHSYRHSPFLMLGSMARVREDLRLAQESLARLGVTPLTFRPTAGITNPRLWRPLLELGLFCVTWSRRARDAGNRRIRDLAGRVTRRLAPGDIILLHDVEPPGGFDADLWLGEIDRMIRLIGERGLAIVPLADLIGRPVMDPHDSFTASPARAFYDAIAEHYDEERSGDGHSQLFIRERELFETRLLPLVAPHHRVLEIGAGTGIFTIPLAGRCREVTAVELSARMGARMMDAVLRSGITSLRPLIGDAETVDLNGKYDIICSFSMLEYVRDAGRFIARLAGHLKPGGLLYLTTAHRSPFRLFTQIGNAMRQGIWLAARTRGEVRAALRAAGLEPVTVSTHVLRLPLAGGMLLEVMARCPDG